MAKERVYPNEDNLGRECEFWSTELHSCFSPKTILFGRVTCRGMVDEPCLYLKDKRPMEHPEKLDAETIREVDIRVNEALNTIWQARPDMSSEGAQ